MEENANGTGVLLGYVTMYLLESKERESRYILKGKAGIMSKSFFPPIYIYIFSLICSVLYATLSSVRRRPLSSSSSSAAAGISYGVIMK